MKHTLTVEWESLRTTDDILVGGSVVRRAILRNTRDWLWEMIDNMADDVKVTLDGEKMEAKA